MGILADRDVYFRLVQEFKMLAEEEDRLVNQVNWGNFTAHFLQEPRSALLAQDTKMLTEVQSRMREIHPQIRELEVRINDSLLALFGPELYDLYREKHPINNETRVVPVTLSAGAMVYHYVLPMQESAYPWGPALVTIQHSSAPVELWQREDGVRAKLVYAPEINTVFIEKA